MLGLYLLAISLENVRAALTSPANATIQWVECTQNATLGATSSCGSLTVPLDYTEPSSNETIELQLLMFTAANQPSKGSVLINPGGPGDSSREFLASYAPEMMIATGGYYDLIAFETRGVGNTLPFACFPNATEEATLFGQLPPTTNDSDTSLSLTWALGTVLANQCNETNNDIGSFLSTAFIARDMMQIVDALGEDGFLRYYGFSYGTVLGATAAAMFPSRIDRMVLDGVVNIKQWLDGSNNEEDLQTDDSIRAFAASCIAEPTCALQRSNYTGCMLYDEIVDFLEDLKYNPIVLGNHIIQYGTVKSMITLYTKSGMLTSAFVPVYLSAIMERNQVLYERLLALLAQPAEPLFLNFGTEALFGIQCPDTALRASKLMEVMPLIDYNANKSYFGSSGVNQLLMVCAQWEMKSKETFTGPFDVKTKNPILFVSSPYDPNTPMVSARNMSEIFAGSVVLQQNGVGHTSIAQPSVCTIKATSAYFLNGTLPEQGKVCLPTFGLLSNHTVPEVYLLAAEEK